MAPEAEALETETETEKLATGGIVDQNLVISLEPEGSELVVTAAAVPAHSTATTTIAWSAATQVKRLPSPMPLAKVKATFAWYDSSQVKSGEIVKGAAKFPHHIVSGDGTPGAASTVACSAVVGALNGARTGSKIPDADRKGVYNHVIAHLKDAGVKAEDLPVLASMDALSEQTEDEENDLVEYFEELIAAGAPADNLPARWDACLVVEGLRTTDHRAISPGALSWRDLPVPLMMQPANNGGHAGSVPVGKIESITRDGNRILANGSFDLGCPEGQEAARSCAAQVMRFLSIDLEVLDMASFETDDDWFDEVLSGRIGMATMVPMPAFPQACIVPEGDPLPDPAPMEAPTGPQVPLIAALTLSDEVNLVAPPAAWFQNPQLAELTHLTVTEDGRVYGHLAGWTTAHRGIDGRKVYAPRSPSGYAHFATGTVVCDDGTRVATGPITMGTGHADGRASLRVAAAHYDDVTFGVADVCVGEDEHGLWMAGAIRPGITDEQVRVLRASDVSGDWRPTAVGHELVAALVVNVAGFLIPNSLVASAAYTSVAYACFAQYQHEGEPGAIVAAGLVKRPDEVTLLRREIATLRAAIEPLMPLAVAALDERLNG